MNITATDLQVTINRASGTSPSIPGSALDWTQSVNLDANAPLNGTFTIATPISVVRRSASRRVCCRWAAP